MAVQHEIKSQLAKLLATEDLIVEHRKVETACFNVHTRVLCVLCATVSFCSVLFRTLIILTYIYVVWYMLWVV